MTKDLGEVTVVATGGSLPTDPTRLDVTVTENDAENRPDLHVDGDGHPGDGGRRGAVGGDDRAGLGGGDRREPDAQLLGRVEHGGRPHGERQRGPC